MSRNGPFTPSRTLEMAYERAVRRSVGKLPRGEHQSVEEWLAEMRRLSRDVLLHPRADKIARAMVAETAKRQQKGWRAVLKHNRAMHRLLQQELQGQIGDRFHGIIARNAELIRSVPLEVAQHLTARIAKLQQAGVRAEKIAAVVRQDAPHLVAWKCRLIARTEVAKASSALVEARAREIGSNWAVWRTSRDGAVRKSHRLLDGVLFSWDDLPAPEQLIHLHSTLGQYGPGGCPNCRCSPFPVISLQDVEWPARVYSAGRISRFTRSGFASLTGVVERVAA